MMIVDIFLLLFLVSSSFGGCCRLVWVLGIRVLWCYFVLCVIVLFICGYFRCTYARIVQGKTLLRKALKIRFFYGQYLWIPRNYYGFDKMRKHKTTKIQHFSIFKEKFPVSKISRILQKIFFARHKSKKQEKFCH